MSTPDRITDRLQLALLLGMALLAGAASFSHVRDLAAAHGQPGWFALAVAVSIEAMSIAAGLEIRRSRRLGRSVRTPAAALVGGVTLSLAAQVAEAEPSVWGWLLAAVPAMAFLVVLKFALRRLDGAPESTPEPATATPVIEAVSPPRSVTDELTAYLSTATR